ncbi:MAG: deoxyribose-phosphate aldolase, partial [Candidatus Eisenbacteria bacterium]|nr:deoxyribose-phosphate aldolase [Candidatus Eisenbacteria bacterium]
VQPIWVPLAARILEDSRVKVCTVIGFPHGANRAEVKGYETEVAVAQGAREVDMVIPIGMMKSGDHRTVAAHVRAVVRAAMAGVVVKVILENAYLTDEEKRHASRISKEEGAHFVKTSTGFGPTGATLDDVRLMRAEVGPNVGVKAAGGIRDTEGARAMVAAGANRIGASASVRIASR